MNIITISCTRYKEKGAIINALSEKGMVSFYAPNVFNKNSKTSFLKDPFTHSYVDIEKSPKNDHYLLKDTSTLFSPLSINHDLDKMASFMISSELFIKMLHEEEMTTFYKPILHLITSIKENKNMFMNMLSFLAIVIKESGYGFETNSCVSCGSKKDIAGFSFIEGGFVCKECFNNVKVNTFNKNELLSLREIFSLEELKDEYKNNLSREEFLHILKDIIVFTEDNYGYKEKYFSLFC